MENRDIKIGISISNEKTKTAYLMKDTLIFDYNNELSIKEQIIRIYDLLSTISKDFNFYITITGEVKK